jgi:hypothetical protein
MLESSEVIAFAAATDDFDCVLDAHGTMLRVTAVPKVSGQTELS